MTRWVQVNVGLDRSSSSRSARSNATRLFGALAGPVARWRGNGGVIWFFFQRKPPDVRLRFLTPTPGTLHDELGAVIETLREEGVVASAWFSEYEPEYRKFGGLSAMAAVHEWFDVDTSIWLDLELDGAHGSTELAPPPARVCAAVANDLFGRVLGDTDEVWDTWCNFRALLPRFDTVPSCTPIEPLATIVADAPARHRAVLGRFSPASQRLAGALQGAAAAGELTVGLRAVLPFVAQHSFQRWGLDGPAQAAIVEAMSEAWCPHRDLRGA